MALTDDGERIISALPNTVFVRLKGGRVAVWTSYMGADGLMDGPPDNETWYGLDRVDLTGPFTVDRDDAPCRVYAGEFAADDRISRGVWEQMEPRYRGTATP